MERRPSVRVLQSSAWPPPAPGMFVSWLGAAGRLRPPGVGPPRPPGPSAALRHAGSAWEGAWRPEREVWLLPQRAGPEQRPAVLRSGRAAGATSASIGPGPAALGVPRGSAAAVTCPPAALGALHRLAEPFGAEGTCRPIPFPPRPRAGTPPTGPGCPNPRPARPSALPGMGKCIRVLPRARAAAPPLNDHNKRPGGRPPLRHREPRPPRALIGRGS